ncbi:MAG: hypothetical protein OXO48_03575 [Caldilineaceae bacterium]|nr:hypothetical protein [Caldilineaceae bacterium]
MSANIQDVLKVNIVLIGVNVLSDHNEFVAFSDAVETDVVRVGEAFGGAIGQRLALQRDRISIITSTEMTIVEREFPLEGDLKRLAEVANHALSLTQTKGSPKSFGYNLELVYDQDSEDTALQHIGTRLFREDAFTPEGWELRGGGGRLVFDSSDERWTVQFEPRFNDMNSTRVFLSLNLHKQEERIPEPNEMLSDFNRVWSQSVDFVECLDKGRS